MADETAIANACDAGDAIMDRMVDLGLIERTDIYDSRFLEDADRYHEECEGEDDYDVTGYTPKGRELFECIYNEFVAPFDE